MAGAGVVNSPDPAENPIEIIIRVIDQNDNKPQFNQSAYEAKVPEAAAGGKRYTLSLPLCSFHCHLRTK